MSDVDNVDSLLKQHDSGIAYINFKVDYSDKNFCVGYMDKTAIDLLPIELKEGRYPENSGEVVIEKSTYSALKLTAAVGERVSVPVVIDGESVEKEYTLVGITENYLSALQYDELLRTNPLPTLLTADKDVILRTEVVCGTRSACSFFCDYGIDYSHNGYAAETLKKDFLGYIVNTADFLFCIIILVTVFGIIGIYVYTLRDRRKFMSLLRCIGLKRRKGVGLLFIQGSVS